MDVIGWGFWPGNVINAPKMRVVLYWTGNCEENSGWNALATAFSLRTIIGRK
jgi:hypothetical protein